MQGWWCHCLGVGLWLVGFKDILHALSWYFSRQLRETLWSPQNLTLGLKRANVSEADHRLSLSLLWPLSISFLLFGRTQISKLCVFACKYTTQLCSYPLCQQENPLVLCLAWIITKLFVIRMWGCDLTAIFSFPFSVFNTFQKLKIPNLSLFFLMLISNGNIAKQSAQYLCFVHLLPSLKINWLYSTLFSIFLHLDIIALCSHPKVTVIT